MPDLIDGNSSTTYSLAIGESSYLGAIEYVGDIDWWRVSLVKGYQYQVWLEGGSSISGTLVDPYLAIYNSVGIRQLFNDDISIYSRDSYLTVAPNGTDIFYLSAEEYGSNATGTYKITIWLDQLASTATAANLNVNAISATEHLGWQGDISDWYSVNLTAGTQYEFDLIGSASDGALAGLTLTDPYLTLRNSAGLSLLSDNDSGVGWNARILYTPTSSGTFYLDAQQSVNDVSGTYRLIVNSTPTSGSLTLGVAQSGAVGFNGDIDRYSVSLMAGVKYGFSLDGISLSDPYLEVQDSAGSNVASDDDSGSGLNSFLTFSPTTTGTYYLTVRESGNNATGTFSARAWQLPSISIGSVSIVEGNSSSKSLDFPVSLSEASPVDVIVTIGTRAGTASTGSGDYEGIWETTLTIPAGETKKVFSIAVNGDSLFEPREGFRVVLSSPVGATIGDGDARGWIIDDDAPYPLPSDPLSRYQWHLYPGIGVNVFPVWSSWDGSGIKVAVFDWGIDSAHLDLNDNLIPNLGRHASSLVQGGDPILTTDNHGTAVAGVIAAEANGSGVIGVAPKASLVSIYNSSSSSEIANAFSYAKNFDVLNNSWGFAPQRLALVNTAWAFYDNFNSPVFANAGQALRALAETGRNGLGTIVVQSAGNSYDLGDDTNLHNFQNSRYIITVAGTDYQGAITGYSSPGASVLIAAPGGEVNANNDNLSQIYTTDRTGAAGYSTGDYTFIQGTSFSGPVVSGIVALMLDANPLLGYRDVQQIIAYSGRRIAEAENSWTYNGSVNWNGGGLHFDSIEHNLGFGLIDALVAVRLAESWTTPSLTSANDVEFSVSRSTRQTIPDGISMLSQSVNVTQAMEVERVEVTIDISHAWIGDLGLCLTSPAGTNSWLLWRPGQSENSPYGQSQDNINFTFNTVLSWGEASVGTWTLSVYDKSSLIIGTLNSWTLNLIGKPATDDDIYVYTNEFNKSVTDQSFRASLTDTSGIDQINTSAVTSSTKLNLQSGSQSTIDGRLLSISFGSVIENAVAGDGEDTISGNQVANSLRGMRGNDMLSGLDGDDKLEGGAGNDAIDGGAGKDTALFNGLSTDFEVKRLSDGSWTVKDTRLVPKEGVDTLIRVEDLQFNDKTIALNEPPVANAITIAINEDTSKTGTLTAMDVDASSLTYSKVTNPSNGTVVVNSNGTYTYTPNANFSGADAFSFKASKGVLDSTVTNASITVANTNDAPTGSVTLSGTATQGQVLTASNTLTDADGLGTISYQWLADGVNISGATTATFTLTQAQVGKAISVKASYTDLQGTAESVASSATASVANSGTGTSTIAKFWKDNTKTPSETKKADAVNLTDAIGILKMIVGLNVNSNNTPLSPYQAIAADFDQSGDVGLTDAIGVLKMVVGLSAPTPTWKYYDDAKLVSTYTSLQSLNPKGWTTSAVMSDTGIADSSVKLVGVLTGDVDGSWTGA